jgi:hypothetical protein
MTDAQATAKHAIDGAATVVTVANIMEWFPPIVTLFGSLLTVIWFAIRIYETETVQKLVNRKKPDDDAEHK